MISRWQKSIFLVTGDGSRREGQSRGDRLPIGRKALSTDQGNEAAQIEAGKNGRASLLAQELEFLTAGTSNRNYQPTSLGQLI